MNETSPHINSKSAVAKIKTLLVIRHAKSSWNVGSLNDFERPLNDRGKKDAPMMANRLIEKKIDIQAFVSSPAKRAKKTAELFCNAYRKDDDFVIFMSMLYHAPVDVFYEVVDQLDDEFSSVAIFSHNPGITEFVNTLIDAVHLDNMPTCGIFAVQIHCEKWKDFKKSKKDFLFIDYPKLI
ncbi:histidine phosphatase family protein [soil metagenome]